MYNKKVLIDSLKKLGSAKAPTQKKDTVVGSNNPTEMLAMQKGFSPYDKKLNVKKSNIHGKGLFTEQPLKKGELIGLAHVNNQPTPIVGNFHNHSENNATALSIRRGNQRYLVAAKDLEPGTEITTNYRLQPELGQPEDFPHSINETPTARRGGSTPKLPNKKNSRAYSRSLDATNRLFAEHPWFKKSKSRKNKIYDPNAKYYANGGESRCPEGYAFNPNTGKCIEWNPTIWNTVDEPTSFDPVADIIYMNPNDRLDGMSDEQYNEMYKNQLEHEQFHRLQWLNGELKGQSKIPYRMPSPVQKDGIDYYNRRNEEADYLHNYWKNMHPHDAEFIPDEVIYNNETNPAMYQLPWTAEGEAIYYQDAVSDGVQSFFPKRKKGGALPKAQYGLSGLGDRPGVYFTPFDFRTQIGQTTDFYKNPNYSLTYTIPKLYKKAQLASNPLSFTIGRPYYTDTERLTNPALDYDPIFTQDYHSNPVQQLQYGPQYQQYLQDVSDYTGTPVSNLNQTKVNQYNAAQNLAAVKPKYNKPGAPLTANLEYSLFGNLPGNSGAGPLAGSLTLGAGYAPEPGFYGAAQASAYGVFGKRKNNSMSPKTYFNKGLTRKKDRAWIPGLNIMDFSIRQRSPYNDAQTQRILELYKEDIQNGTTRAEDFIKDQADQSSKSPFSISALSPSLTYQRYFEPLGLPVIFSATAGLRNTIEGKDATKTTVGGQWTTRPYGNVRLVVPMDRAIDRLKDLDLPPIKKRRSYYDYVNENEQTDDNNEPPTDNTFPPEDTSTDENTMQPSYDGEGVGKGPCPKGYERLCEECRCTKIQTRRSPLLDKRGIHPYIDGQYLEDGGITIDLTPEEIEEYAKGGYIIEDISIPSLNKMKKGGLKCPPNCLPGQASRALEIIREPEMISTYLGQTTPNLRLPSLRSINIDQFKNLDQWDLKNRKLVYPFKIEAPSGVLEIKPHDYSNVDQNLWELYANMPNQIEAGRAFYMLNQMLQPEPTILQRDSLSSDSLNTMLSVGNKKDWDAEYVGDLPFNFMGRNNQIFKGLNIPTYAPTGVSTPLGEQMVERLNSFIKDKGYGDEAYIATVPGFPRASVYVPNYRLKRRWKNGGEFKKYQPGGQINAIKAIEELRNLKPIRNIGSFQIAPFKTPVFKLPDIKLPDIKMPAVTVASTFIPTISPKDWSKNWNKATGDFQGLMKEYADIEQRTKADNTWMKNADGSPYLGSEYEYIQEQSEPFKKAFPEGFNQVFRGVNKKTAFRDFSRGKKLSGDRAMFTGDYLVGDDYAKFHSRQDDNNILTPFVQDNVTGLYNLIYPKGKEVIYNAGTDFWSNIGSGISDFNSNALLSEFELETTKNLLNARLERLLELQKNNPSNFLKNEIADIQNRFLLLNNNETAFNRIMPGTDLEQLRILNSELKPPTKNDNLDILDRVTTNTLAEAISRTGLNSVILQNVVDGPFGDVHIVNNRPGNYLKSKIGNQGFFKQTPGAGSNIYHKMGGESNYELGDEVDEATMKQLKKLGYTFEKI